MKLTKNLLKALVNQVNMEYASAYLYRSMSHDMKNIALFGYAKWLDKQYQEELQHAEKLVAYIEDRDDVVDFLPIAGVDKHYDKPLDVAVDSLSHEEAVSASIRELFRLARNEGDLETEIFLQWYITEQIEEEVNARDNISGFQKAENSEDLLYMFDKYLSKRAD